MAADITICTTIAVGQGLCPEHNHFSALSPGGEDRRGTLPRRPAVSEPAAHIWGNCQLRGLCSGLFSCLLLEAKLHSPQFTIEALTPNTSGYHHI